jgi:hypothetical protein
MAKSPMQKIDGKEVSDAEFEQFCIDMMSTDTPPTYFQNHHYDYPGSDEYTQDADYVKYGKQRWFVPGTVITDGKARTP